MKSHKVKEKFMELRAQGLSYAKISRSLSVSKPTLIEWGKNLASEIEKLKEIELDAFHERYSEYKRHKVQLFSEQLLKIREELAQRDLSTAKLRKDRFIQSARRRKLSKIAFDI